MGSPNEPRTLEVRIEGNELVIRLPMQERRPSASGKNVVIASTNGNVRTTLIVDGKPLVVGVNAYISREA